MKAMTLTFVVLSLIGLGLLATPAAAINTCATNCSCTTSCATACLWVVPGGPFDPDDPDPGPEILAENCGEYGLCVGAPGCGGTCQALSCTNTWTGTSGNDTYGGTANRECINGLGGNDYLNGESGTDWVDGGAGTDTCIGETTLNCP